MPKVMETAQALGQAFRLAACDVLELDPREICRLEPIPSPETRTGLALLLADARSGGSGHLEELFRVRADEWLEATQIRLGKGRQLPEDGVLRQRALIRELLTADVPSVAGKVTMDAVAAADLLQTMLQGTSVPMPMAPPAGTPPPARRRP